MMILQFIKKYFDIDLLSIILLSSIFLLFVDAKEYKEKNYIREYKFSKLLGYLYIIGGVILFIIGSYVIV